MKYFTLLCVWMLLSCSAGLEEAASVLSPPAISNPYVALKVPLCDPTLNDAQHQRVLVALGRWNDAYSALGLSVTRTCVDGQPELRIDPSAMRPGRCGYTTPSWDDGVSILFGSDACLTECVATHELGHYLGLVPHAPPNEPGPMSDEDRGDCMPSPEDVAILRRTYEGKLSL